MKLCLSTFIFVATLIIMIVGNCHSTRKIMHLSAENVIELVKSQLITRSEGRLVVEYLLGDLLKPNLFKTEEQDKLKEEVNATSQSTPDNSPVELKVETPARRKNKPGPRIKWDRTVVRNILDMCSKGLTNSQIAAVLGVHPHSVGNIRNDNGNAHRQHAWIEEWKAEYPRAIIALKR